jgi:sortase A
LEEDPLLRIGATMMFLALACAVVVFAYAFIGRPPERANAAVRPATKSAAEPLVRSDPGIKPWVEKDIPPPNPETTPKPAPPSKPAADPQTASVPNLVKRPGQPSAPRPDQPKETQASNHPRHYQLPPGAIMSLTIPSIGLKNVPVFDSVTESALDQGVVHLPDTSLPWSDTPERNVYLAGHRLGWPGTGSHLVFYRLDELTGGESITLRDANGKRYDYRVLESFTVGPQDSWVTGRVRGRDLLTLQTCTPIPTFQKRLIVRAERIS